MKFAVHVGDKNNKLDNKDFQQEHWDHHWNKNSFYDLVKQLTVNPIYWELKEVVKKKDSIIEAGCGAGQWVWVLSRHGYKITGIDFAKKTIEQIHEEQPQLDIRCGDVKKLPFKDKTFHLYLSFGVIEHFPEGPEEVLNEAHRVLKKGGVLFLTLPYLNFFRLIRYKYFHKQGSQFYQYLYDEKEIKEKITKAGFRVTQVKKYDFINAVSRDFPFTRQLFSRKASNRNTVSSKKGGELESLLEIKKPNFWLNNLLYRLDSYILLIKATKQ